MMINLRVTRQVENVLKVPRSCHLAFIPANFLTHPQTNFTICFSGLFTWIVYCVNRDRLNKRLSHFNICIYVFINVYVSGLQTESKKGPTTCLAAKGPSKDGPHTNDNDNEHVYDDPQMNAHCVERGRNALQFPMPLSKPRIYVYINFGLTEFVHPPPPPIARITGCPSCKDFGGLQTNKTKTKLSQTRI